MVASRPSEPGPGNSRLGSFDRFELLHEASIQSAGQVPGTERLVLFKRSTTIAITIEQVMADFFQEPWILTLDDQGTVFVIARSVHPDQGSGTALARQVNGAGRSGQTVFSVYQLSLPCMVLMAPRVRKTCSGS